MRESHTGSLSGYEPVITLRHTSAGCHRRKGSPSSRGPRRQRRGQRPVPSQPAQGCEGGTEEGSSSPPDPELGSLQSSGFPETAGTQTTDYR